MGRIARIVCPGMPHHVVQRGNRKEEVFFDDEDKKKYLRLLQKACRMYNVSIWAWCLMPNHKHSILSPVDKSGLSKAMQWVAKNYSSAINEKYGWSGHLWEDRFYSSVIEEETQLWRASRYVEMNPVRARLIMRPEDWSWSSAREHLLKEKHSIISIKEWLTESEMENYRIFLNEKIREEEINRIRQATKTGKPLGSDEFIGKLEQLLGRTLLPKKPGRKKKEIR